MKDEQIIVSLTTWNARIGNLPVVLDNIYAQTIMPDKVVLNLAYGEVIPQEVLTYIEQHQIEVYRTEDTKVYKKFMHTLRRYPQACVINIDDDLLYPHTMIEDFMAVHEKYPDNPVCGNHSFCCGRMCHCGEASLTKYEYFGECLDLIDDEVIKNCPSSDLVFSYLATKAGHPYVPAQGYYGTDYTPAYQAVNSWTKNVIQKNGGVQKTFGYLENRFGKMPELFSTYVHDANLCELIVNVTNGLVAEETRNTYYATESAVRNSLTHRIGKFILHPSVSNLKRLLHS